MDNRNNSDAGWAWENAGGKFGLSADWRVAVVLPGDRGDVGSPSRIGNSSTKSFEGYGERDISGIRGKACLTQEKQEEVRQILDRRKNRPPGTNKKVYDMQCVFLCAISVSFLVFFFCFASFFCVRVCISCFMF